MNYSKYNEKLQHGDRMFPLNVYHYDRRKINKVMHCHWHDEIEFIYIAEGSTVLLIDNSPVEVKAGQAVIINSNELHSGDTIENSLCEEYAVVFNPILLYNRTLDRIQSQYVDPIVNKEYFFPRVIVGEKPWEIEVLNKIKSIIEIFESKSEAYELGIKICLLQILHIIISTNNLVKVNQLSSSINYDDFSRLIKVIAYIESNYKNKMEIAQLAQLINVSYYHFFRFFKTLTDRTPIEYINHYRVTLAATMLRSTKTNVSEIALETGFDNISYFSKVFRSYYGCTPLQYRCKTDYNR